MPESMMTDYAIERMRANEIFLLSHLEHVEIIELINDAIDVSRQEAKDGDAWIKSSKHFFFHPILLPSSYAIHTHLLTGNLPACFRELRFLFESLAFCYFAEKKFPEEMFFLDQMKKYDLTVKSKKSRKTISQLLGDLENETGIELNRVYGRLSDEWVHTRGFAEKVENFTSLNSQLPSWAWILPITLDEKDLTTINELNQDIALLRNLLEKVIAS